MTPRRNLDRCPSCSSHLTPQRVNDHRCPFCSADLRLASRLEPRSAVRRALRAGRSSLLAASIFSMTTLSAGACSDEEPEPIPDASDTR